MQLEATPLSQQSLEAVEIEAAIDKLCTARLAELAGTHVLRCAQACLFHRPARLLQKSIALLTPAVYIEKKRLLTFAGHNGNDAHCKVLGTAAKHRHAGC